ncbi:MAG: chemotaxis protein CheB [Deltaproteobacteria bacterium]
MIRVLVVEDSKTVRERIRLALASAPGLSICGMAKDGREGVALARESRPDVVLMDLNMPDMNGFEATRQIMTERAVPVVVLTSLDAPTVSTEAFECGAAEILSKEKIGSELCALIRSMAGFKVVGFHVKSRQSPRAGEPLRRPPREGATSGVVLVGASTGGPQALQLLLGKLSHDSQVAFVIVQHIADGFVEPLVDWLQLTTPLPIRIARGGEHPAAGAIFFAPDRHHLRFAANGAFTLGDDPAINGVKPAVDALFSSAAKLSGISVLAYLMTGMGGDGAVGLKALRDAGATTLTQSEESCVIYGMPAVAVGLGASQGQLGPVEAAAAINGWGLQFSKRRV